MTPSTDRLEIKEKEMETTTPQNRWPIRPIDLSEARELFKSKLEANEDWLMIVHAITSSQLLIEIENRYYGGPKNQDFTIISYIEGREVFALVIAKRRHVQAYQLASMIRKHSEQKISERELSGRSVIVIAPGERLITTAAQLVVRLLGKDELAMSE